MYCPPMATPRSFSYFSQSLLNSSVSFFYVSSFPSFSSFLVSVSIPLPFFPFYHYLSFPIPLIFSHYLLSLFRLSFTFHTQCAIRRKMTICRIHMYRYAYRKHLMVPDPRAEPITILLENNQKLFFLGQLAGWNN